jgi:hypothetical protein
VSALHKVASCRVDG